jgi:alkanesulfonate monooxygenase SsuD/methylene tetrahydromethanopterin reductase-like flavin-dependent oxidoreductase (luciferase family)
MTALRLDVAVMIEGQEGLTWERWQRLARAAEDGGFAGLYRSDHLTGLFGDATRASLETWASLAWLATATRRIRFGPIVCPMTFYQPALLAKRAAAIDQLAGGRLDLGVGAGWNEMEHRMFGVPFPPLRERMDRLECGARVIRALWGGGPVTLEQPYYPLHAAESRPRPVGARLVVGGRGERRTMRVAAELGDEWNVTRVTLDDYPRKLDVLAAHGAAVGRDPASIRRSVMVPIVVGRTRAEVAARLARGRACFPRVPETEAEWRAQSFLFGSPDEVVRDLGRWRALGVTRVMLQCLDMDDLDALEVVARDVLPALG